MKIAIIGCGGISRAHSKDIKKLIDAGEDLEVKYLVDIVKEKALKLKAEFGFDSAEVREDYKEVIPYVDAAVICTPHTLHFRQALDFVSAGKHVLVEKPMTHRVKEAYQLVKEAEKQGVVLEIAYQRHFIPKYIVARDFVLSGGLGDVKFISLTLAQGWYKIAKGTWRGTRSLGGGGELIDSGSHISDIAFWTTGLKPVEVFAYIDCYDIEVDVNTCLSAKLTKGALLSFTVAGDDPSWLETEIFWGDRGRLVIFDKGVVFTSRDRKTITLDTSNVKGSRPIFNFIDAINGKDKNKSPAIYGLYVAALSEAAYKSIERMRPISVKELCKEQGIDYSYFLD